MAFFNYASNIDNMRRAQAAYDHQLPDDAPAFLETVAGANWLYDAARDLIRGMDLRISGRTVLCCSKLHEAVDALIAARHLTDYDRFLAQAFIWAAGGADPQNFLAAIIKPAEIEQIAEDLVRPFAELRLQELRDEANEPEDE